MAEFNGFILTNKGRELLAKAIAGETLTFTKISFGDGLYEGDKKEIQELAGLKNVFFINQIKKTGVGQVSLRAVITNRAVETGYHIKEIGIYAVCGNEEEVLYAYNTAVEADYLPPFNGNNLIELEYQNYIVIDQAEKVTAIIDKEPKLIGVSLRNAKITHDGFDRPIMAWFDPNDEALIPVLQYADIKKRPTSGIANLKLLNIMLPFLFFD